MITKTERDRLAVLIALNTSEGESVFGEECYFPFASIMSRTGLDRTSVRNACRVLKRRGYTDFKAGLWTEDGEPAGAGYRITAEGKASLGPNVMAAIKDAADAA